MLCPNFMLICIGDIIGERQHSYYLWCQVGGGAHHTLSKPFLSYYTSKSEITQLNLNKMFINLLSKYIIIGTCYDKTKQLLTLIVMG